jgi:hypothetical protein
MLPTQFYIEDHALLFDCIVLPRGSIARQLAEILMPDANHNESQSMLNQNKYIFPS